MYSSDTGDPLSDAFVEVLDSNNAVVDGGGTGSDGSYAISNLTPGLRYKLCVSASHRTAPLDTRGYANQCWYQIDWLGHP